MLLRRTTSQHRMQPPLQKEYLKAEKFLSLPELKILFNEEELLLVKKGNRLSIIPIEKKIAKIIIEKII